MGPYDPPKVIKTEVAAVLPERFTRAGSRPGKVSSRYARPQVGVDCYLEGPSFDRDGHLYFTDVPHGRIFRMAPSGDIDLVSEYDGEPNGLKIHKDGRIFIADYRHGIMVLEPESGAVAPFADLSAGGELQGAERPRVRQQRRSVLHRPGQDRAARPDRPRLPLHRGRPPRGPDRDPAGPQRPGARSGREGRSMSARGPMRSGGSRCSSAARLRAPAPSPPCRASARPTAWRSTRRATSSACSTTWAWSGCSTGSACRSGGSRPAPATSSPTSPMAGPSGKDLYVLDGNGKILVAHMPVPGLAMYAHR